MKTGDVINLIAADNGQQRALSVRDWHRARLALAGAVLVSCLVFAFGMGVRPQFWSDPVILATARKEAVTLCAAMTGLTMVWLLSQPLERRSVMWLAPGLLLAALVGWELLRADTAGWQTRMIGQNGLACLLSIPFFALAPLVALFAVMRTRAPANPALAGGAAGFAASGIGASIYALHCTDDSMLFVAFWYCIATAVLVAAGAMAGRRLLTW